MPKDLAASPYDITKLRSLYREIEQLQFELATGPAASAALSLTIATELVSIRSLILMSSNRFPLNLITNYQTATIVVDIIVGLHKCLQLGGFGYGFVKLRQILLKYCPNSIYTMNQQPPKAITQLRSGDLLYGDNYPAIYEELTAYHRQLSTRANYPFIIIFIIFGLIYILNSLVLPLVEDSGYADHYFTMYLALTLGGFICPIATYALSSIHKSYKNWNATKIVKNTQQEFNTHFNPKNNHPWKLAGGEQIQTNIIYTTFTNKDKMKIHTNNHAIEIPVKKYFQELAKVLVSMELHFLFLAKDGLYIGLDKTIDLVMEKAEEFIDQRLKRHQQLQDILKQLNLKHGIGKAKWEYVVQSGVTIFFISPDKISNNFFNNLKTQYPNTEVIEKNNGFTFVIENPKLIIEQPITYSQVPTRPDNNSSIVTAYPRESDDDFPAEISATPRTRHSKSNQNKKPEPSAPKAVSKPKILVTFPKVNLQFNSVAYIEATALVRPMHAAWLPNHCHFSYLDPRFSMHLPADLDLVQVLGILRSGKTYPSGILKGKKGHVGICVANEPYTNIHGQTFISDYKIKTSGYRLHGRLYDTATDKRRRVYIFDGVRKHGH